MTSPSAASPSVAASLGLPARYAFLIPVIFGACEGLGSSPEASVALLRRAGVGGGSRVLELACGKGVCAAAIARDLHATVRAIDACESFIDEAKERAADSGVSRRCRFEVRDIHDLGRPAARFDAVVMIGLLGHESAPPLLRAWTREGGVYLFDDATPRTLGDPRDLMRAAVEHLGDALIGGRELPAAQLRARIRRDLDRVRRGTRCAADTFPRLRRGLDHWFEGFARAAHELEAGFRTGTWLIRKGAHRGRTLGF